MTSLRWRLLIRVLGLFLAGWLVVAAITFRAASHEVEELFDAQLAQSARVLLDITLIHLREHPTGAQGIDPGGPGHDYETKLSYQVWAGEKLLFRSRSAPTRPLAATPGYSDQTLDDGSWRVFVLPASAAGITVQVGESYSVRDELIHEIAGQVLFPLLLALPLLAYLIWVAVGRGLRPLHQVAGEVAALTPHQLHPIAHHPILLETQPLVEAVNRLLSRLADALEGERRFTADAAHELRTPLASVKLLAQVAMRARDAEERDEALQRIVAGVDRSTHLVHQLLTLARLDPEAVVVAPEGVNLHAVAEQVLADIAPLAVKKGIELGLTREAAVTVMGHPAMLAALMRNLVDNAVRYTPVDGRVEVVVTTQESWPVVMVDDSGPGVAAGERETLFRRFKRGEGRKDSHGCGLGLSIVRRIAELHNAEVTLHASPLGGLRAQVRFHDRVHP